MDFSSLVKQQREFFFSGATRPVPFRVEALRRLATSLQSHESEILAALKQDLGKPAQEGYASEVGFVLAEIEHAARCVKKWARPQRRHAPRMAFPSRAKVVPQPRGLALILGPW